MPDQAKMQRLKAAGLKDVDKLPDSAVNSLARLSDAELSALAKAQADGQTVGTADFGGLVF